MVDSSRQIFFRAIFRLALDLVNQSLQFGADTVIGRVRDAFQFPTIEFDQVKWLQRQNVKSLTAMNFVYSIVDNSDEKWGRDHPQI
jgi:hypothetical protein